MDCYLDSTEAAFCKEETPIRAGKTKSVLFSVAIVQCLLHVGEHKRLVEG